MGRRPGVTYPFSAIVGQDALREALMIATVDPSIGGVLVRGEKGTAKSTAVRALATLMPDIDVVDGCAYGCDPSDHDAYCRDCKERREADRLPRLKRRPGLVNLPVSATEDRLIGSFDLEHALKHGERRFSPGLLAEANRGILYVDEVNLLADHLIDTLLDVAAMGVNSVEREGISVSHPSRFVLVGTMNPEEGDVRPQLLDRFGLCVEIETVRDADSRVEIMKRRKAFDENPSAFVKLYEDAEKDISTRIRQAQLRVTSVEMSDDLLRAVADIAINVGVEGHRADLVISKAAAARAALDSRTEVTHHDVIAVAPLVLSHRMKRRPFEDESRGAASITSAVASAFAPPDPSDERERQEESSGRDGAAAAVNSGIESLAAAVDAVLETTVVPEIPVDRARRSLAGRRQESVVTDGRGRYVGSEPARSSGQVDVAFDATLRAAAPHQLERDGDMAIRIRPEDLQQKIRKNRVGASIVFCVDASGSMGACNRMESAKRAILDLLVDAYQRRDRVGLVSFRGETSDVLLSPTSSVELAQVRLKEMPTGGATPLASGMLRSLEVLQAEARRDPDAIPWLVLVTDGRANIGLNGGLGSEDARSMATRVRIAGVNTIVIDTGSAPLGTSSAKELAKMANADYVRLHAMDGPTVASAIRERVLAR